MILAVFLELAKVFSNFSQPKSGNGPGISNDLYNLIWDAGPDSQHVLLPTNRLEHLFPKKKLKKKRTSGPLPDFG